MERESPAVRSRGRQALPVPRRQVVQEGRRRSCETRIGLLQGPAGQLGADRDVVLAVPPSVPDEEGEDVREEPGLRGGKRPRQAGTVAVEPPPKSDQPLAREARPG